MKKIIILLVTGLILSGFSNPVADTGDMTELNGYKLRHNQIDLHDFNLWVVTNEDVFSREFEPLNDSVLKPDFGGQFVLAARVETINYVYRVKFKRTVLQNGNLNVYMNLRKQGTPDDTVYPLSMVTVPKDKSIRKVNFFHDNVLVKSVPIVTVY